MQHARSLSLKYDNYWGPMTVETLINGVVLLCTTLLHSSISTKPATKEALFDRDCFARAVLQVTVLAT